MKKNRFFVAVLLVGLAIVSLFSGYYWNFTIQMGTLERANRDLTSALEVNATTAYEAEKMQIALLSDAREQLKFRTGNPNWIATTLHQPVSTINGTDIHDWQFIVTSLDKDIQKLNASMHTEPSQYPTEAYHNIGLMNMLVMENILSTGIDPTLMSMAALTIIAEFLLLLVAILYAKEHDFLLPEKQQTSKQSGAEAV
jgi:hypothetical protein